MLGDLRLGWGPSRENRGDRDILHRLHLQVVIFLRELEVGVVGGGAKLVPREDEEHQRGHFYQQLPSEGPEKGMSPWVVPFLTPRSLRGTRVPRRCIRWSPKTLEPASHHFQPPHISLKLWRIQVPQ